MRYPEFLGIGLIGPHPSGAEVDYEVRMLAPSSGMLEDPITGSLNAALDPALEGEYLEQFLFHLTYDGAQSRFFRYFSQAEREVTLAVLTHIWQLLEDKPAAWVYWPNLDEWIAAVELWEELVAVRK